MNESGHVMLLDKEFNQVANLTMDFLNSLEIL
jgi:esterase/lipase